MSDCKTLLYVEDDANLAYITIHNLEKIGHRVLHCLTGPLAYEIFSLQKIDLCLLDVMLPEMDGLELASKIRKKNAHVPIIFITAKSQLEDRIKGLRIGADDYIVKPYYLEELILKIDVFLKRPLIHTADVKNYYLGAIHFDFGNLLLSNDGILHRLTLKEAELLRFLISNANNIVKRDEILNAVWGSDDYFLGRSLDVFISRLRKYLSAEKEIKIENIHGVGFRLIIPTN